MRIMGMGWRGWVRGGVARCEAEDADWVLGVGGGGGWGGCGVGGVGGGGGE